MPEDEKRPSPFRSGALDRLYSPEEIDERLVIIETRGWFALGLSFCLVLGAILWAFFGQIPHTYSSKAIYFNERGFHVIRSPATGVLFDIKKEGMTVADGDEVASVVGPDHKRVEVKSDVSGTVLETLIENGGSVKNGDDLLIIDKGEGLYRFYAYVPIDRVQLLHIGMKVYLVPADIDASRYGQLIGEITSISPFVVSKEHLMQRLGIASLVDYFTQNQPVYEVIITPKSNPQAPSGYAWTEGKGPPNKIEPRSLASALFILPSKRPISYIFPSKSAL